MSAQAYDPLAEQRTPQGPLFDVLLAGNALAVHDVEQALFGTSLGVDLNTGKAIEGGHRHHMRAINTIFRADLGKSRLPDRFGGLGSTTLQILILKPLR